MNVEPSKLNNDGSTWNDVMIINLPPELLSAMKLAAIETSSLLKTLGNPDRLLLLCQLTQGEACVSELEVLLGIQQPTLSQQLTVLRNEGLVVTRRDGKHIYYAIGDEKLLTLLNTLYQLYCPVQEK